MGILDMRRRFTASIAVNAPEGSASRRAVRRVLRELEEAAVLPDPERDSDGVIEPVLPCYRRPVPGTHLEVCFMVHEDDPHVYLLAVRIRTS